jgi:protein-S-isoprenylcysteine O-methyltransferase Ste14
MAAKKPLPPSYFNVSVLLLAITHFFIPIAILTYYPWNLIGVIPIIFGIYLNLAADKQMKEIQTTVKPFEESSHLIEDGVFAFTRNPMYLGMVLILAGIAILLGSLTPLIICLIFAFLMFRIFIRGEEEMLETIFGQKWLNYKKKVRRWI